MKEIYDNGYYMLGKVENIIKYLESEAKTSDMEEVDYEIIKELKEDYSKDDIVNIYYDNPMGYTITVYHKNDVVWLEKEEV